MMAGLAGSADRPRRPAAALRVIPGEPPQHDRSSGPLSWRQAGRKENSAMTGWAWIFIVLKIVMPRRAFALPVMAGCVDSIGA